MNGKEKLCPLSNNTHMTLHAAVRDDDDGDNDDNDADVYPSIASLIPLTIGLSPM